MSFNFLRRKFFNLFAIYKLHPVVYEQYISEITVTATSKLGTFDISDNFGLVGLKPLVLAFSESERNMADLEFIQIRWDSKPISKLFLISFYQKIPGFALYKISDSENFIRNLLQTKLDFLALEMREVFREKIGFSMKPKQIRHLFNFCLCPRKVFLISCHGSESTNTFPLDVVGIYPNGTVLFSVRKSNKMNPGIQMHGEVLLSNCPSHEVDRIYNLGKNYNQNGKPLEKVNYLKYNEIAYPDFAFDIHIIQIHSTYEVGEHLCYLGNLKNTTNQKNETHLAHVPWFWRGKPQITSDPQNR